MKKNLVLHCIVLFFNFGLFASQCPVKTEKETWFYFTAVSSLFIGGSIAPLIGIKIDNQEKNEIIQNLSREITVSGNNSYRSTVSSLKKEAFQSHYSSLPEIVTAIAGLGSFVSTAEGSRALQRCDYYTATHCFIVGGVFGYIAQYGKHCNTLNLSRAKKIMNDIDIPMAQVISIENISDNSIPVAQARVIR